MTENKSFDKTPLTKENFMSGEYESCSFTGCDLSEFDLSDFNFIDCDFNGCNLSMARLDNTSFTDTRFKDCKMMGLQFRSCNDFLITIELDNCVLNFSSFYKLKLKKTKFKNSTLHEVDFTEADLSGSVFDNCDLTRASFHLTNLENTDFRSAFNFSIDPEINKVKKARFSVGGLGGLLDKYGIRIE